MKPKQPSLREQLEGAISHKNNIQAAYDTVRHELSVEQKKVVVRGIEIEDLKKQVSWHKQMNQQLVQTVDSLARSK